MSSILYPDLSDSLLEAALKVYHQLGCGLFERAYEEAFCHELSI